MATQDTCTSIAPYFKIPAGKTQEFKALCERFVEKTKSEPGALYYGFCFDGDQAHCREGYANAEGLLAHLENVGALLQEMIAMVELTRLEIVGPESELAKLRGPLATMQPQFYALEFGFRK